MKSPFDSFEVTGRSVPRGHYVVLPALPPEALEGMDDEIRQFIADAIREKMAKCEREKEKP